MTFVPIFSSSSINFFVFPRCESFLLLEAENLNLRKIILLSLQKHDGFLLFAPNSTYESIINEKKINKDVLVLAKITSNFSNLETPDIILKKLKKIKISGISRVCLTEYWKMEKQEGQYDDGEVLFGKYEKVIDDEFEEGEKGLQILTEKLARSISSILEKSYLFSADINSMNKAGAIELIDFISQNSGSNVIEYPVKFKLLNELNPEKRLEILINLPNKRKRKLELEGEIDEITKKNIQRDQEAYYLLKRKEAIERRLRESRGYGSEEIKKILERLDNEPFPKRIKELVYQKIEQLETSPNNSGENGMIKTYINWVMNVPWWKQTEEINDLELAKQKLDEKHYGLVEVKDRIIEYLAARQRVGKSLGQVICLLGPPGVGKTSLAESIAEATGRKFASISLGGINDESEIRGSRSTYVGSYPGKIVKALIRTKAVNPLILIDEIDKIGHSLRGDPAYALLEVLDPSTNKNFVDNYLGEEAACDLSQVFFICTANDYYDIPLVLADRLEIIFLSSYTEKEKLNIAKNYLIPEGIKKYNLSNAKISIDDSAINEIIEYYTKESGVRRLKTKLDTILRKFIVKLVKDKTKELILTQTNVRDYLKQRSFLNVGLKKARPGVFNGLAWTIYGGEILPIEVAFCEKKGKEENQFTGNLGSVFKESCLIALTYIISNHKKFDIKSDFFSNNSIHINALETAVEKDGPSAGVALVTAIISAVTKKSVVPDQFAATGEISINGWISVIGGLKEKLIAAERNKIKTVFIPKQNEGDLADIPEEIRNNLKIICVENYDEVWDVISKNLLDTDNNIPEEKTSTRKKKTLTNNT